MDVTPVKLYFVNYYFGQPISRGQNRYYFIYIYIFQ
jgi:hypothetical protein